MKVALIRPASSSVPSGSYNIQEIGLAKALASYGIQADVYLVNDKSKEYEHKITVNNIDITIFRLNGIKLPGQQAVFYNLFKRLRSGSYDLLQVLDDSQIGSVLVSIFGKRNKIPVILWQGMYADYTEFHKKLIQIVYDFVFLPILRNNVICSIAKTRLAAEYLNKKNFRDTKIGSVGLDDSALQKDCVNSQKIRRELGLTDDSKVILYIGKIESRRRPLFILSLFEKICKNNKNVNLLVIGSGKLEKIFIEQIGKSSVKDKIKYFRARKQSEIVHYYSIARCFILPSVYEIFGMVILESMFYGVPVITSYTAGSDQVIDDGKNGRIIRSWDEKEWLSTLEKILSDDEYYRMLSFNARKKVEDKLLWNRVAENYSKIYSEILKTR